MSKRKRSDEEDSYHRQGPDENFKLQLREAAFLWLKEKKDFLWKAIVIDDSQVGSRWKYFRLERCTLYAKPGSWNEICIDACCSVVIGNLVISRLLGI